MGQLCMHDSTILCIDYRGHDIINAQSIFIRHLPINPMAAVLPHGHTKQREGSAGLTIRIAEKDQRILESQEYIQVWIFVEIY